jgi:hypothetical protein
LEIVQGQPLGDVTLELATEDRDAAWASCGASLAKAHAVTPPGESHGVVVGRRVRREAETWGHLIWHNLKNTAYHLHDEHGIDIDADRVATAAESAIPPLTITSPPSFTTIPMSGTCWLKAQTQAGIAPAGWIGNTLGLATRRGI